MKRVLSTCAVICILAGLCIYAAKVGTAGGRQEDSTSPDPPIGILTDSNVVDAGNHVAAYRVPAEEVDVIWTIRELFEGDYIVLHNLDSEYRIYIPDTYGTIMDINAQTPGEIAIRYLCEENGEERQTRIPIAFAPQENGMRKDAYYYHRDRVVAATQELDAETFPVKIWSETFEWKGDVYEAVFERTSPVFDLQLEAGGLFADYCLTVRDGKDNIISRQAVANYPIDFEEVYWFTDFSGDGIPDVAVCTGIFWGKESWSCLDFWIWDGESSSFQGKFLPKEREPSMPLWDEEQSVLVSCGERDEERTVIVNMYTYVEDQWVLVRSWIPLYGENLWLDEAKNIRRPDSYRVVDYADGEVVREEIMAAEVVWEDDIWSRNNERYCQLYPGDPEWETETVMIGEIPVDKVVRAKGEGNETAGEKKPYLCVEVEDGYELTLYDRSNKNVFSTKFPKEPGIRWVTEDILEISISVGSPAVYVFWFDTENVKISDTYFNPILVGGKYVAYMENNEELLLRDIFGEGLLEMSVIRNFSQAADPMSAVMQMEMTDHEHIVLTYFDGPDYTEVSETIKIENGCNEKEESDS